MYVGTGDTGHGQGPWGPQGHGGHRHGDMGKAGRQGRGSTRTWETRGHKERRDMGTWGKQGTEGHGDMGTWGTGDTRERDIGDRGTQGQGDGWTWGHGGHRGMGTWGFGAPASCHTTLPCPVSASGRPHLRGDTCPGVNSTEGCGRGMSPGGGLGTRHDTCLCHAAPGQPAWLEPAMGLFLPGPAGTIGPVPPAAAPAKGMGTGTGLGTRWADASPVPWGGDRDLPPRSDPAGGLGVPGAALPSGFGVWVGTVTDSIGTGSC